MPKYRLIVDLATNRVIYYTADSQQKLYTDQYSVMAEYDAALPEDITPMNAWGFRYRDKVLTKADIKQQERVDLLVLNRASMQTFILHEVAKKKAIDPYTEVDRFKYDEAKEISASGTSSHPMPWTELTAKTLGVPIDRAVAITLTYHARKVQTLLQIETIKEEAIKGFRNAENNEHIFSIRQNAVDALNGIFIEDVYDAIVVPVTPTSHLPLIKV